MEDAEAQFADVETTLSHLFRVPHPLLRGATYAERLADTFWMRGLFGPQVRRIVEVGGGLGHLAAGLLTDLKTRAPEVYAQLDYTIVDLSPALRRAQEARLTEAGVRDRVRWVAANAEELDAHFSALNAAGSDDSGIDLFVSNEVVGDFTTLKLTRELCGLEAEDEADRLARIATLGRASRFVQRLNLKDAPDPFYFNIGALELVEKLWTALRPGGGAFISEYGEIAKYPIPSTQLDHLEFSIHFGHLHQLARGLGFQASVEYVQDLIKLDRNAMTLTTTRTYFQSLRAMMASFGVELDKTALSDEMLVELCEGKVDLETIGDLRFETVDSRCMGLAPHEFKALILRKEPPRPTLEETGGLEL